MRTGYLYAGNQGGVIPSVPRSGQAGKAIASASNPIIIDDRQEVIEISAELSIQSGAPTVSVYYTLDNLLNGDFTADTATWLPVPGWTALAANFFGSIQAPCKAIRMTLDGGSAAGTARLGVAQSGPSGCN